MNAKIRIPTRFWLLALAALTLATAGGGGWLLRESHAEAKVTPPVAGAGAVCFGYADVEPGVTSLYPVVPGRVAEVLVRENESVAAGAVLLRLDDRLPRIKVREAQAGVAAANAMLDQVRNLPEQHEARLAMQKAAIDAARSRLEVGRVALGRKKQLEGKYTVKEDVRGAEEEVKGLEAAVRAEEQKLADLAKVNPVAEVARAQAAVAASEAQLAEARHQLDECELRAPSAGEVLRVLVGNGDVLGVQPRQPAVLFCPALPRIIRVEVEQEFAGRVKVGQSARVEEDCNGRAAWQGKVQRLSDWYTKRRSVMNEPGQFNDVRTLECIIELEAGQPVPRIGQRMRVLVGAN